MSTKASYATFCEPDGPANIFVFENNEPLQDKLTSRVFTESSLFIQHIETSSRPKLRIVSIPSITSLSPLQISRDALEALQHKYEIGSELWNLTTTFGNKPLSAAAGEGCARIHNGLNDVQEISYRFTFPVTGGPRRWTMRQAGIFRHVNPKILEDLWIFFHASPNTQVHKELEKFASRSQKSLPADTIYYTLHQAFLKSCLDDWRSYVNYLGNEVDKHFDRTLSFIHESMNNTRKGNTSDGNLADIHNTRNRLLEIPSRLMTTLDTLQKLHDLSLLSASQQKRKGSGYELLATSTNFYKETLQPLLKGVEIIKERVKDTLNMIEIGLTFRMTSKMLDLSNHSVDLNKSMLFANEQLLQLGSKNFDDNATVRIVTLVTLIYLPASLVSSVIGMNLFDFDDGTGELRISKQFWIFVVATLILSIITLTGWYLWTHKEQVMRRTLFKFHSKQNPSQNTSSDIQLDHIGN